MISQSWFMTYLDITQSSGRHPKARELHVRLEAAITPVATSRRLTVAPTISITWLPTSSMRMLLNSYALDSHNRKLGPRRGTTVR